MDKEALDTFFANVTQLGRDFTLWTDGVPKFLVINPDIISKLARAPGFFQRDEVKNAEITESSPIVRRFNLGFGVVTLLEDWDEQFLHYE